MIVISVCGFAIVGGDHSINIAWQHVHYRLKFPSPEETT